MFFIYTVLQLCGFINLQCFDVRAAFIKCMSSSYVSCLQLSFNVQGYQIVGRCAFLAQTACLLDLGFVLSDIALLAFSHAAHEAIIKYCRDREGKDATPQHEATARSCRTDAGREWPLPNILSALRYYGCTIQPKHTSLARHRHMYTRCRTRFRCSITHERFDCRQAVSE